MPRHVVTLTVTVEMEIEPEVIARAMTAEWQRHNYRMGHVDEVSP